MTRVLFLAESFHPVLGGGETHVRRLGSALACAGDVVTVVTRRGEPSWPAEEELDGIRVVRVPPSGPGRRGKFLMIPAALRAVLGEARRHDVLVVRGTRVLGLPGLVAARVAGLGVVLQPETNGELSGEAWTWGKAWAGGPAGRLALGLTATRNLLLRDADAFVAMSRAIRAEMLAAGVPGERIELLPHGVDTERFRPAEAGERAALRSRLGLPDGVLAAWSGRLLRGKGLETLLEALARAARAAPDLRLVLAGSGEGQALSIEDALRRRAAEDDLAGRVVFAGRVERVEDVLRAADFFVFPSVFEALGISLVEAAACGLGAVASRTGGIVDVVDDGRSGLLAPPGDPGALAEGLLALGTDASRRAAMGREARRAALARFDERDGLVRYRALFREVSPRRTPSSRTGRAPRAGGALPPSPASRA
ncbi:MAG TPA: glycosyltransferase family 4 protein [Vicinamibacteria bacterium]|nr:glycosyltransferase family 4 protein [Vicinamibacteria bacterium]